MPSLRRRQRAAGLRRLQPREVRPMDLGLILLGAFAWAIAACLVVLLLRMLPRDEDADDDR
jgi:hypothetical protein